MQRFCTDLRPILDENDEFDQEIQIKPDLMEFIAKRMKMAKNAEFEMMQSDSLNSIFNEHNYGVTELLNDFHHLKYEHNLQDDDDAFDSAFNFTLDGTTETVCYVNECPLVQRHYRVRGRSDNDQNDEFLADTMAMIHCYFVHSFDLSRLTKEERDKVDIVSSHGLSLDDEHKAEDQSDDNADDTNKMEVITEILKAKQMKFKFERGVRRYGDDEESVKCIGATVNKSVDFGALSKCVGIDAIVLGESLREYRTNRDQLICDLMDVVYAANPETEMIWSALNAEDNAKNQVFRDALHAHFKSTDLNNANFLKMSKIVIERKMLKINANAFESVVTSENIDGKMLDKSNKESYRNMVSFSNLFKSAPDCYGQHLRQLYTAIRKWKHIQQKTVEVKQPEETVEHKDDEKGDDDQDTNNEPVAECGPDVYEIGKRFYFWEKYRKHPDFVQAKYDNMKEEILNSPLVSRDRGPI